MWVRGPSPQLYTCQWSVCGGTAGSRCRAVRHHWGGARSCKVSRPACKYDSRPGGRLGSGRNRDSKPHFSYLIVIARYTYFPACCRNGHSPSHPGRSQICSCCWLDHTWRRIHLDSFSQHNANISISANIQVLIFIYLFILHFCSKVNFILHEKNPFCALKMA